MNKDNILIVCALEQETRGQLDDYDVLYTGVGKVNATYKLTLHISGPRYTERLSDSNYYSLKPKLVINYGTAGSRDLPIGELVDCTRFIQRDMNVTGMGFHRGQTPFENDIPLELDFRNKPFNVDWGREHHINTIKRHLVCGSGDNFVDKIENEIEYVDVFDMEAYALAKVCYHYKVPFISFKYITDNANEHSPEDWEDNLGNGIVKFKEQILKEL
jgi:adenosylhomocysteine nucleosidase